MMTPSTLLNAVVTMNGTYCSISVSSGSGVVVVAAAAVELVVIGRTKIALLVRVVSPK